MTRRHGVPNPRIPASWWLSQLFLPRSAVLGVKKHKADKWFYSFTSPERLHSAKKASAIVQMRNEHVAFLVRLRGRTAMGSKLRVGLRIGSGGLHGWLIRAIFARLHGRSLPFLSFKRSPLHTPPSPTWTSKDTTPVTFSQPAASSRCTYGTSTTLERRLLSTANNAIVGLYMDFFVTRAHPCACSISNRPDQLRIADRRHAP